MLAKEEVGEDHAGIVQDRCERHTNSDEGMVGDHAKGTQMTKEIDLSQAVLTVDTSHVIPPHKSCSPNAAVICTARIMRSNASIIKSENTRNIKKLFQCHKMSQHVTNDEHMSVGSFIFKDVSQRISKRNLPG